MIATILNAFTRPGDPQEAALHGGDAGALPARRLHPGRRASTSTRSRTSRSNFGGANILGFLNLFSRRQPRRGSSLFALGIMPYITASIILQLLTVVVPSLEKLSEGGRGRPAEDHAVHALPDRRPRLRPVARLRLPLPLLRSQRRARASSANFTFAKVFLIVICADRRLRAADVARRADHPARHRQRHLADDLRLDRLRPPERDLRPGGTTPTRSSW